MDKKFGGFDGFSFLCTMLYVNDHLFDFDLNKALALLSEQRREQALRFRHELGQRTCAAAYLLLCEGLRREYGIDERPLFEYGEHGKPAIVGRPDIHFNLSHCREAAVCYLSDRPVGIDVESIHEAKRSLVNYTMNEDEQQLIFTSPRPALTFTRLWTMKEAVAKLTGQGITNDLKNLLNEKTKKGLTTAVSPDERYIYSIAL
jgi:4'-phosphopantetheinyl transferase